MQQFQTQIPDPLRENEPKFLAPGGVRTPAGSHLLLALIGQYRLERSPVQVEIHHIGGGERTYRQGRLWPRCASRGQLV